MILAFGDICTITKSVNAIFNKQKIKMNCAMLTLDFMSIVHFLDCIDTCKLICYIIGILYSSYTVVYCIRHWSQVPERIQFKLAVLVHRVVHGNAPEYLGPFTRLPDVPIRSSLRSASFNHLLIPPVRRSTVQLVQGRLRYLDQLCGTVCRLTLRLSTVCQSFVVI